MINVKQMIYVDWSLHDTVHYHKCLHTHSFQSLFISMTDAHEVQDRWSIYGWNSCLKLSYKDHLIDKLELFFRFFKPITDPWRAYNLPTWIYTETTTWKNWSNNELSVLVFNHNMSHFWVRTLVHTLCLYLKVMEEQLPALITKMERYKLKYSLTSALFWHIINISSDILFMLNSLDPLWQHSNWDVT